LDIGSIALEFQPLDSFVEFQFINAAYLSSGNSDATRSSEPPLHPTKVNVAANRAPSLVSRVLRPPSHLCG
jgi:hypothetical protein